MVFKGGTSLSKGYKAISRFSEDIDITFDEHIGEARRKKLKNNILKGISEELNMPIANWCETQSDRDYNAYYFTYESVLGLEDDRMLSSVKLETALGSYAFPTEKVAIGNYIGDYLVKKKRLDLASQFLLDEFNMKLQVIERTYIDKIFALCDYYMKKQSKRFSRHLYDIYKLTEHVEIDADFLKIVKEVRAHRIAMGSEIAPAAPLDVDILELVRKVCDEDFYKEDYRETTLKLISDSLEYEMLKKHYRELVEKVFE